MCVPGNLFLQQELFIPIHENVALISNAITYISKDFLGFSLSALLSRPSFPVYLCIRMVSTWKLQAPNKAPKWYF